MPTCRYCSKEVPKLTKQSHIVPKWMYEGIFNDEKGRAFRPDPKTRIMVPVQDGIWRSFLCQNCEEMFGKDDTSASNLLTAKNPTFKQKKSLVIEDLNPGILAAERVERWSGINFRELQKFVFGVLLRQCYGSFEGEEPCLIGEYLLEIRRRYEDELILDDAVYPIAISRLVVDGFETGVRMPVLQNWVDFGVMVFMGGGYVFQVYVPSHDLPPGTMDVRLRTNGSIFVKYINYKDVPWFKLFDDLEILTYRWSRKKQG